MSVMNKPDYKIFAQDAKSGEYVAFPDILRGWGITQDQYNGFPPMELFNSAAKRIDEWLMYLTQRGLPEWDAAVDYPKDAMIQHAGVYYVSLKATKGEQPNNSQASWKKLTEVLGVDGKLAKDQNGADIPNKPKFIENLGLPELLDKKFDKTGGKITGQTDIEAPGGRAQTLKAMAGTSIYQELYLLEDMVAWWGIVNSNEVVIENRATGQKLFIGPGGFKIDGKNIATTDQLFGVGQTYKDVTASRKNSVRYQNTSTKPIVVCVEYNRTNASVDNAFSCALFVNDLRVDYRWTQANEIGVVSCIVPAGSYYEFKGGWGQSTEWESFVKWVEFS